MFLLSQCFASKVCVASLKEFPFHIQSAWHVLCWGVGSRGRCLTLVPCQEGTALPRALWGLHCGPAGRPGSGRHGEGFACAVLAPAVPGAPSRQHGDTGGWVASAL